MDPQYIQMLMDLLASQQGDMGYEMGGDPYAPSGGFPSYDMPNGKMPQYRTQGSGYVSDGTVRDMLNDVLVNQDKFSSDAFMDLDPTLKPFVARAVSEGGHDVYNAYALADDDAYKRALLDMAMQGAGAQAPELDFAGVTDTNADGVTDVQDMSYDQYLAATVAKLGNRERTYKDGRGRDVVISTPYQDILQRRMQAMQGQVDDFFTQAAPTNERNLNDLDYNWQRVGGMPYAGINSGSIDYAGSGPAFAGGRGPSPQRQAVAEMVRQFGGRPKPSRRPKPAGRSGSTGGGRSGSSSSSSSNARPRGR